MTKLEINELNGGLISKSNGVHLLREEISGQPFHQLVFGVSDITGQLKLAIDMAFEKIIEIKNNYDDEHKIVDSACQWTIYDPDATKFMVELMTHNRNGGYKPDMAFGAFLGYTIDVQPPEKDSNKYKTAVKEQKFKKVPFEDRFGMLVNIEYSSCENSRRKRLICNVGFDQSEASIMDINYTSECKRNNELISRLATCEYIAEHRNFFITGVTGCGKTYMACAFGMEICKQYYNTRYIRMSDLLMNLDIARTEGNYCKVMAKYSNPVLFILDKWLLLKPTDTE